MPQPEIDDRSAAPAPAETAAPLDCQDAESAAALSSIEAQLLGVLDEGDLLTLDELTDRTKLPFRTVSRSVFEMELKGLLRNDGFACWERSRPPAM